MRLERPKWQYRTVALYVTLFLLAVILGAVVAFRIDRVFAVTSYMFGALMPVSAGAVIAYLLSGAVGFFENKVFAVFLAEPVSDIIAAAVTTFAFFRFFLKMLKEGKQQA